MNIEERRVILDRGFDRALSTVLDAFLRERFAITPTGAGDVHRPNTTGRPRRYAMLETVIPELDFRPVGTEPVTPLLGCRVSVFELTGSCTLVSIESPVVNYPALSGLVPRVTERLSRVVHTLLAAGNLNAA